MFYIPLWVLTGTVVRTCKYGLLWYLYMYTFENSVLTFTFKLFRLNDFTVQHVCVANRNAIFGQIYNLKSCLSS